VNPFAVRAPLLALGAVCLVLGVGAGLARLGWGVPAWAAQAAGQHAALMIVGFFGTVIALERAVALGRFWGYVAPPALALSALAATFGRSPFATAFALAGAGVLATVAFVQALQARALHGWILACGALAFAVGVLLWLADAGLPAAIPCWLAFFVFTICGERLELARVLQPSSIVRAWFIAAAASFAIGVAVAALGLDPHWRLFGAGLVLLALWLALHDIARRTVRQKGLTRYIAVCLLAGYAWLAFAGLLFASGVGVPGAWDAALHALLVGFVLSMVFGHAPIIFPAVLSVKLPYTPLLYVSLAVLHASLLVRVIGGAIGEPGWRAWGGAGHAAAILLFILTMVSNALRARRR
jgi:hypothetical protein